MLTVPQLEAVRADDPLVYEALKSVVAAVNSLGQRLNVDPHPASASTSGMNLPPPAPPASIAVTGARGVFSVALAPGAGNTTPISYFVEAASDAVFSPANTVIYPLGGARVANVALGNVTRYWRARAKYIESDYSPYVYFGTQAAPTAVVGGLTGSGDQPSNVPFNQTNFATVDSIDAGGSATVRIYGTGGVGSSWTRQVGSATTTYSAGTITGLSYSTTYYVYWNGSAYLASASFPATLPDGYVWVGKVTTVASGGGGGVPGGGGSGGGGGGRPNPN
jgi:hypothetical protein